MLQKRSKVRNASKILKTRTRLLKRQEELMDGVFLNTVIDNAPASLRQIQEAINQVKNEREFRLNLMEKAMGKKNHILVGDLSTILSPNFVTSRLASLNTSGKAQKKISKDNAMELFDEYFAAKFSYASVMGEFIGDEDFADSDSLAELNALEGNAANLSDDHPNSPIVRAITKDQELSESNPGVIPEKNKLKKGMELFKALQRLAFKIETLRRLETFSRYAPVDTMYTALRDISEIDDINPVILFEDALEWDAGESLAGDLDNKELQQVVQDV